MKKEDLKALIKEILKEMTGTGAVAGYNTPFAFGNNKKKTKETAEQLGYKIVKEEEKEESEALPIVKRGLNEARYHNFRNHPMKQHAKLSLCLREVKKMLREIDFLTNISDKLKMEAGVSSDAYWNTVKERDIPEIYNRLSEIQRKLNRLTEKKGK